MYNIARYPRILKGLSSSNFLFSPNFEKFIDINYQKAAFVIKEAKSENVIETIHRGLISISFKRKDKSEAAIRAMASRIMFYSEDHVRIVSKEGIDCVLNFRNLDLQSFAMIDNFEMDNFDHPHLLLEPCYIQNENIAERLMSKVNRIKQIRSHTKGELEAKNRSGEHQLTEKQI